MEKINVMMLRVFFCFIVLLAVTSCKQSVDSQSESASEAVDSLELRIESDADLAAKREAALLLVYYVKLDGDEYVLDISEDEASELGVSPDNYRYQSDEIKKANEVIARMRADGDSIELLDIQTLMRGVK